MEGEGELQSKSKLGFDQVVANSHGFLREIMSMHKHVGYQTILPLFLWPGNEASTTTATEQTPVTFPVKLATFH